MPRRWRFEDCLIFNNWRRSHPIMAENGVYKIQLPNVAPLNHPFQAEFRRINVVLGSNGTGKSKLLEVLKEQAGQFGARSDVAFVEGGRTFIIPHELRLDAKTFGFYTLDKAEKSHQGKRKSKLATRITEALFALEGKGNAEYRRHSDAAQLWIKDGSKGEMPLRSDPPLEKLFRLFSTVFPEIALSFDHDKKSLSCRKNKLAPYHPSALSDGEKQVFCLIADLLLLSSENPLIVVDEPELNLNPSLAIDLWRLIESTLSNAVFIYATHCVSFAMRREVETLFVLPKAGVKVIQTTGVNTLPLEELKPFLGAIPSILASTKALIVEGEEKGSLDSTLYRWLVDEPSLSVEAVGSCNSVVSAVKRDGIWETLGEPNKLVGVIDRDFRSDHCLSQLEKEGVYILPFHEIESVFCIPNVLVSLAASLNLVEKLPIEADVVKLIIDCWEKIYIQTAARRTFEAVAFSYSPSLPSKLLESIGVDATKIEAAVIEQCKKDATAYFTTRQEIDFKKAFAANMTLCKSALDAQNIEAILKLIPAKTLAGAILPLIGCNNLEMAARALTRNFKSADMPNLKDIRFALRARLALPV